MKKIKSTFLFCLLSAILFSASQSYAYFYLDVGYMNYNATISNDSGTNDRTIHAPIVDIGILLPIKIVVLDLSLTAGGMLNMINPDEENNESLYQNFSQLLLPYIKISGGIGIDWKIDHFPFDFIALIRCDFLMLERTMNPDSDNLHEITDSALMTLMIGTRIYFTRKFIVRLFLNIPLAFQNTFGDFAQINSGIGFQMSIVYL